MKSEYIKEMQELAALKAENETLLNESKEWSEQLDAAILKEAQMREVAYKLTKENERLKEEQELWIDYYNTISKLQADKESILKEVKDVWDYLYRQPGPGTYEGKITAAANTLESLLSKHEAK